jgi:hypothetical protein
MSLSEVRDELREPNRPVPRPRRLPTEDEVRAAESRLDLKFPGDYRRYLLEAADVVYGALEPAVVTPGAGRPDLVETARSAWNETEVPRHPPPICEDNGDYYCLNEKGEVQFWSRNGTTDEKRTEPGAWLGEVWMKGARKGMEG